MKLTATQIMAEGEDNADLTAAELAIIGGKRSYNRAISLAFSQAASDTSSLEHQVGRTGYESGQFSKGTDEGHNVDYEDENDNWDDDDDDDDEDEDEDDDVEDEDEKDIVSEDVGNLSKCKEISTISSTSDVSEVKRNKKKRKYRQNQRLLQKQFLSTFDNIFEPQHSCTKPLVEPGDINLDCPVPTLVELCLKKGIQKTGISDGRKATYIAPGIQVLLKVHTNQQRLEQVHLKWLLESLKQAEHQTKSNICNFITQNGQKIDYFIRGGREVNLSDNFLRVRLSNAPLDEFKSTFVVPVAVEGYENSDWAVASLAHCINLLLPSHIHEEGSKEAKSALLKIRRLLKKHTSTLVRHCFDTALAYVWWSRGKIEQAQKALLNIVDYIPSDRETKLLPDKKNSTMFGRQKSLYLNELGRMLTLFSQPDSAVQYYRQAVDVIGEISPVILDRLVMQSFILSASAYDQGLMHHSQAVKAATFWDIVTRNPNCTVEMFQASVESFLHCHTGFLVASNREQDQLCSDYIRNKSWLLEADSRIEKVTRRAPQVYLHHSLILSMLGEEHRAEIAYSQYVQQFVSSDQYYQITGNVTGSIACSRFGELKTQPWWMLLKWISAKADSAGSIIRRPIPGMPLLWRRPLRHAAYSSETSNDVAEVQGRSLNLHLTHDGYLSGTMLQNLPPIKSVLLDPHTGNICIPEQHRQHELQEWDNYLFGNDNATDFCVDAFIPIPILLFHNPYADTSVTLLNVNNTANVRDEKFCYKSMFSVKPANITSFVNYSKGRNVVKVNMRELVVKARKKAILQQMKNTCACKRDQTEMKDCDHLLDFCITRGLQIDFSFVKEVIIEKTHKVLMETVRRKMSAGLKDIKSGQKKKKGDSVKLPPLQALSLQEVVYVGESTVVLCLCTAASGRYGSMEQDTLVFLDCSSQESIKNPVIHCASLPKSSWLLPTQKTCWKSKDFKQNVFFAYNDTLNVERCLKRTLVVFDERGNIIQQKDLKHPGGEPRHRWQPYIGCSGQHILGYCTNNTSATMRVWDTQDTAEITKDTQRIEHFIVVPDMVFVSQTSGIMVLDPGSLEPLCVKTKIPGCASVLNMNGILIQNEWRNMRILATSDCSKVSPSDDNKQITYIRVILGLANHVLILEKQRSSSVEAITDSSPVEVVADILVPGIPMEAYYISKRAGLVVAASVFADISNDPYYRENLYWFSTDGVIQGIHPMIGRSPHSFTAIPLGDSTTKINSGEMEACRVKCWHLFFDDGLGALCCLKFDVDDIF